MPICNGTPTAVVSHCEMGEKKEKENTEILTSV